MGVCARPCRFLADFGPDSKENALSAEHDFAKMDEPVPFWKHKTLRELDDAEWESLCDGCGRCCLNKVEFEDTGEIVWTDLRCKLLDPESCRCSDYANRQATVPDCIRLTVEEVETLTWLPPTCGYRLVKEGRDLYWWHPLISGDPDTVHAAGISVRGRTINENNVHWDDYEEHEVDWPGEVPEGSEKPPVQKLAASSG
jgi:uncharacterized cysteine cluster protein YcgN (CxxCxxCC family)